METLDTLLKQLMETKDKIVSKLDLEIKDIKKKRAELEDLAMFSQFKFDPKEWNKWIVHPHDIRETKNGEFELTVPRMFNFNVGHLIRTSETHNTFAVNKFSKYLGTLPSEFEKLFTFKDPLPLRVFNGVLLTGEEHQSEAWERYREHLQSRDGKDKIKIKKGSHFELLLSLIQDDIMPFMPKPVDEAHLIPSQWTLDVIEKDDDRENVSMRLGMDFFKDAVATFMRTGAVGVFWGMGVGKTLFGLMLLSMIRVGDLPNLIVAGKYKTLLEQWQKSLDLIVPAAPVVTVNYQNLKSIQGQRFGVKIIDEGHNLPADTFAEAGFDNSEYRAVMSATPKREDNRTELIFALSGEPIGLNWRVLIDLGLIKVPDIILYLCDNYGQKKKKLAELLKYPIKTLVYCRGIAVGKDISKTFNVPHVYGATPSKERIPIIKSSLCTVISSVGGEGLSIRDLERTISFDFHFGSAQEEAQFFGRLLHGEGEGQHIIFMTHEEHERYSKRLYLIKSQGFKIQEEYLTGSAYKTPKTRKRPAPKPRRSAPRPIAPKPEPKRVDTSKYPMLDDRDAFSRKMLIYILGSPYAIGNKGLSMAEIKEVLDYRNIKYPNKGQQFKNLVSRFYQDKDRKIARAKEGKKMRYFVKE